LPLFLYVADSLHLQYMFLVPTNILVSGNTTAVEGTSILLTCLFNKSHPPVHNVTFLENGQVHVSGVVCYHI